MLNPKGWTEKQLKSWLSSPSTQEGKEFDLKAMIPPNPEGRFGLKKDFCGFANGRGGFLFFGVKDDKTVIGINQDDEFNTKISEIVTKHIFPPTINWELYEYININTLNKFVYIIKIFESPYWQKPHVFFEQSSGLCIPLRENGNKLNITNGSEIRRIFLKTDCYYPEYDIHVFEILKKLKSGTVPSFSLIESNIIQGYKTFLRSSTNERRGEIIENIEEIEKIVAKYNHHLFSSITEGNEINNENNKDELGVSVDNFISKYE